MGYTFVKKKGDHFMRLNRKMTVLTAALALGLMTGCGGTAASASTASSAAASSVPTSSAAGSAASSAAADAVEPIENDETIDELKNGTSSYKVNAALTGVKDGEVTLEVYAYDAYEEDDVSGLQVGSVIRTHDEQTGELKDVTIESLEKNEYGDYSINGGIEEGGIDLIQDRGVFRTVTFDGYPVYYKVGDVTLPLAEDVTLEDSSADPQASAVVFTGADKVEETIAANDGSWNVTNTTLFVQDGHVFDIQRVWVP